MSVNKDTSTINPFRIIYEDLGEDTWRKVTLQYLDWVNSLMKLHKIPLETYGDVFKVLKFMEDGGAIELKNEITHHSIRRGQNFGKDKL